MRISLFWVFCLAVPMEVQSQIPNNYHRDTIAERTDPKSLDLTTHQLYIDTTGASEYTMRCTEWLTPSSRKFKRKSKITTLNLGGLPSRYVYLQLYQRRSQFVLYDRCDGSSPHYEFKDSTFIVHSPHESETYSLKGVELLSADTIELKIRPIETINTHIRYIRIVQWREAIYKLIVGYEYGEVTTYMTSLEGINDFEVVVNHCPIQKEDEFNFW